MVGPDPSALSSEGSLDHPLSGPREELFWRRELLASTEAPRSRSPVVDSAVVASLGATFAIKDRPLRPDPVALLRRSLWLRCRCPPHLAQTSIDPVAPAGSVVCSAYFWLLLGLGRREPLAVVFSWTCYSFRSGNRPSRARKVLF